MSVHRVHQPHWPAKTSGHFVDELFGWFESVGRSRYDETVSQLDHALQAAYLADRANDSDCAVAAALLHDIGHLLMAEHEGKDDFLDLDLEHEIVGARWLARMFPDDVTGPIEGHVRAKRYLCTVDIDYQLRLSDSSRRSFVLQGGELSAGELRSAEQDPNLAAAIALRRRDDAAKVAGRQVPGLIAWRELVESLVLTPTSN